jgi:hypothetical protein
MTYEIITEEDGTQTIKRTNEDGSVSFIPADESNSDYQAYLNPVEHLTEIPTS